MPPLAADFPSLLAHVRPAVEAKLVDVWDRKLAKAARYGAPVADMVRAARDLTLRGGKRFRAALVVAAYHGVDPEAPLEAAYAAGAAMELLQTYLLIQDDWMDGDLTRRGGPAVHAALAKSIGDEHRGAGAAILASDFTFGLAVAMLSGVEAPRHRVVRAIDILIEINENVVIGQHLDLLGHAEDVAAMHALKTGSYTGRGPLLLGAALAGGEDDTLAALEAFAKPIGVAFQLRDDLLGTFGTTQEMGKPVGNDLRAGKRTALVEAAEPRLKGELRQDFKAAFGRADATDDEVERATMALEACGARRQVAEDLTHLCREAQHLAARLPISADARGMLAGAATALLPKGVTDRPSTAFKDTV